jgi:hypothetical protein
VELVALEVEVLVERFRERHGQVRVVLDGAGEQFDVRAA